MNESRHSTMNEKFELLQEEITKYINKNASERGLRKKELSVGYKPWFNSHTNMLSRERAGTIQIFIVSFVTPCIKPMSIMKYLLSFKFSFKRHVC